MQATEIEGVTVIPDVANAHYGGEEVPEQVEHPETGEVIATIGYVRTDGWRGYLEATPVDGWQKVGDGCACGGWDDAPPGTSDREVYADLEKYAEEYGEIVVILCGGSNVFAMQFDVLARAS